MGNRAVIYHLHGWGLCQSLDEIELKTVPKAGQHLTLDVEGGLQVTVVVMAVEHNSVVIKQVPFKQETPMADHLLDPASSLPASMARFFQNKFRAAMAAKNRELADGAAISEPVPQIPVESEMKKIEVFCNFIEKFLNDNPPSTVQPMDRAHAVRLINGEAFTLGSSEPQVRGSMQPSLPMHVTGRPAEVAEAYGRGPQNSMSPSGIPQGAENMASEQPMSDAAAPQPSRSYR